MKRVALIAAFRDGLALFGKRQDNGRWTLAGGHLEEGEGWEEGARRELLEETGLEPVGELTELKTKYETDDFEIRVFRCEVDGAPTGKNDPDQECRIWAFFDVADGIPKAVAENMAGPKDMDKNVAAQELGLAKADLRKDTNFSGLEVDDSMQGPMPREEGGTRFSDIEVGDKPPEVPKKVEVPRAEPSPFDPPTPFRNERGDINWDYTHHLPKSARDRGHKLIGYASPMNNGVHQVELRAPDDHYLRQGSSYQPNGQTITVARQEAQPLLDRGVVRGHNLHSRSIPETVIPEDVQDAMSSAMAQHLDYTRNGLHAHLSKDVPEKEPEVRRIHNRFADSKATEATAKMYGSKRPMSERKAFDYTHTLTPEQRQQGYGLTVFHHPDPTLPTLMELTHNGRPVANKALARPGQPRLNGKQRDWAEPGHENVMYSAPAFREYQRDSNKTVDQRLGQHGVESVPFLDTLQLPQSEEGARFSDLEIDKGKKPKKVKVAPPEPSRAAQLEVDGVNTNPVPAQRPKAPLINEPGNEYQNSFDYTSALPESWRAAGYTARVDDSKKYPGQSPSIIIRDGAGKAKTRLIGGGGGITDETPYGMGRDWAAKILHQHKEDYDPSYQKAAGTAPVELTRDDWKDLNWNAPVLGQSGMTQPMSVAEQNPDSVAYDYSHALPDELRGTAGLTIMQRPSNKDHSLYAILHDPGRRQVYGGLFAYPGSAHQPSTAYSEPGGGFRNAMMNALLRHAAYMKQGLPKDEGVHFRNLELSEKPLTKEEAGVKLPQVKPKRAKKDAPAPEPQDTLVGVHNLTHANLAHAHELGGLVAPSLAVTHREHPLEGFGDVSLVAGKHLIDPEQVPVFDADIYSPRHPKAKYRVNAKALRQFQDWVKPHAKAVDAYFGDLDDAINGGGEDSVVSDYRRKRALGHAYLSERGQLPEMPRKERMFPWLDHPGIQAFKAKHGKVNHLYPDDPIGQEFWAAAEPAMEAHARSEHEKMKAHDPEWGDDDLPRMMKGVERKARMGNLRQALIDELNSDEKDSPDIHRFGEAIEDKVKDDPDFKDWVKGKVRGLAGDRYLPKYYDSADGPRERALPYTPENVLKQMTRTVRGGEGFNYGLGSARAHGAKQFRNMAEMAAARGNIIPRAEFEKHKEALNDEFGELATAVGRYHPGGDFQTMDALSEAIGQSYRRGKPLYQALKESGFGNMPPEAQQKIAAFAHKLRNAPTEYFESKPQRVVGLHEFKGAAVPHDSPQETLDILRQHGVNHIEPYDRNDPAARAQAIQRIAAAQNLFLNEVPMNKAEDDEVDRLLLHPNPVERRLALKLGSVKGKHLVRAFQDEDPEIQAQALAHPALDHGSLRSLMRMSNREDLAIKALAHEAVGRDHLEDLYDTHSHRPGPELGKILHAISHHPALDRDLITKMASGHHHHLAIDNLKTDPAVLAAAIVDHWQDPDHSQKRALARRALQHPHVPKELVEEAFKKGPADVRYAIASGPHLPEALAHDVMVGGQDPTRDDQAWIRHAIVTNDKASDRHLETGARDRNRLVRQAARARIDRFAKYDQAQRTFVHEALRKAVGPNDFSGFVHHVNGPDLVDHAQELDAHPPQGAPEVQAYRNHIIDSHVLARPRTALADALGGASNKTVYQLPWTHPTHPGANFIVKPYHEKFRTGFKMIPIHGWAEMTNQALYHAGGIGHLHQNVHVSEHDMGNDKPDPAVVIHMAPGMVPLAQRGPQKYGKDLAHDARRIGLMDYLTGNGDRHEGNLLIDGDEENDPKRLLAIDHGLGFRYVNYDPLAEYNWDAVGRVAGGLGRNRQLVKRDGRDPTVDAEWAPVMDWWGTVGPDVRRAFNKRLGLIKDKNVAAYLAHNFHARADYLDRLAHQGLENQRGNWFDEEVPVKPPDEFGIEDGKYGRISEDRSARGG